MTTPFDPSPRPAVVLAQLQAFAELLNPYEDEHLFSFEGTDEEEAEYFKDWKQRREHFKHHTEGCRRFTVKCLDEWARKNVGALVAQTSLQEQADIAVWAAGTYQQALLEGLLTKSPTLHHTPDSRGDTPLHAACGAQNAEGLAWLLRHDAHLDQPLRDRLGRFPVECLLYPTERWGLERWRGRWGGGSLRESLKAIRDHAPGLLTMELDGGNTLLHQAAGWKRPPLPCQDLVEYGLAWNRPNHQGRTAADVLAEHPSFRPRFERSKERRDARFVQEAVAAGQVPWQPPSEIAGLFQRTLKRFKLR